jgi:hypothetical protein
MDGSLEEDIITPGDRIPQTLAARTSSTLKTGYHEPSPPGQHEPPQVHPELVLSPLGEGCASLQETRRKARLVHPRQEGCALFKKQRVPQRSQGAVA